MGIHKRKFEKGALAPGPVGLEKGLDKRFPCELDVRPTDEEAQENGFDSARQWYGYSAGGILVHPRTLDQNFKELPEPSPEDPEEGPSAVAQQWGAVRGFSPEDPTLQVVKEIVEIPTWEISSERVVDQSEEVADALLVAHPYLLSDVEVYARDSIRDLRDNLSEVCKDI